MSAVTVDHPVASDTKGETTRRQYYIKGGFQRNFILQFLILMVIGCGAFGVSLYLYSSRTLTTAFVNSRLQVMSTADYLLPALVLTTLVVTALVCIGTAIRLIFFSHRIAGPLYRLEKTAQAIGHGELGLHVRLRAKDELQNFASSMDEMVTDLRTQVREIKEQSERLRKLVREAVQAETLREDLRRELQDTQNQLDRAIGRFQV